MVHNPPVIHELLDKGVALARAKRPEGSSVEHDAVGEDGDWDGCLGAHGGGAAGHGTHAAGRTQAR
eukprot:6191868-Pleurochrysis_carterae.AAC.3